MADKWKLIDLLWVVVFDYKFSFNFETFNYKNADIHYMQSLSISDSIIDWFYLTQIDDVSVMIIKCVNLCVYMYYLWTAYSILYRVFCVISAVWHHAVNNISDQRSLFCWHALRDFAPNLLSLHLYLTRSLLWGLLTPTFFIHESGSLHLCYWWCCLSSHHDHRW
jgi:hypothetical protein